MWDSKIQTNENPLRLATIPISIMETLGHIVPDFQLFWKVPGDKLPFFKRLHKLNVKSISGDYKSPSVSNRHHSKSVY